VYVLYRLLKFFCKLLFKLTGGIEVSGLNHIPPEGAFVLVSNHQSLIDPLVLGACLPRRITFLAADYLFKMRSISPILKACGALPVNSPKGDFKSLRLALSQLSREGVIGVFPEGGVSLDGELKPFLSGWAYLALRTGVPAIPVAISGTRQVLPVGKYIPRSGRIKVNIGKPLPALNKPKINCKDTEKLNEILAETIFNLVSVS
jgi:1-acyl-sn-glycerol-3-phosphate acyltransferase